MIIIYYRDRDTGKILDVHGPKGHTMEDLAVLIEHYNAEGRRIATAVEVADDSLEAYLFVHRNQRMNADREAIQDAIEALQNALSFVRDLED